MSKEVISEPCLNKNSQDYHNFITVGRKSLPTPAYLGYYSQKERKKVQINVAMLELIDGFSTII